MTSQPPPTHPDTNVTNVTSTPTSPTTATATTSSSSSPPYHHPNHSDHSLKDTSSHHSENDEKDNEILPISSQTAAGEPLAPVMSRVLSRIVTSSAGIVPRHKRRGLLSFLCIIPEIDNPFTYSRLTKKLITLVVAFAAASAPMASAILFPALSQISAEMGATQTETNLSVALYMLGMAVFPLWWSSFSERVGYRTIFMISFSLYVVCNICCAVSVNIGMFIAFRVFSGASAASAQTIGAGVISSIWEVHERGRWMGIFYLGPLMGPLLSPIIGGALTSSYGWRSTLWFLAAFGALVVTCIIFLQPETYKPKAKLQSEKPSLPSSRETEADAEASTEACEAGTFTSALHPTTSRTSTLKDRSSQWIRTLKILLLDPLRSLGFIRFPPVLITVYWASLAFGALYILNVSIQKTFAKPPYNFPTIIIGLMYLPNSIGYFITSIAGGKWNDIIMRQAAQRRRAREVREARLVDSGMQGSGRSTVDPEVLQNSPLDFRPEDRMGLNAWIAGGLFPLALLMYGWTVQKGVFWFVSCVATFLFGIGSMLVFSVATTMLTEFVPGRSASAVAVNNFFRNICSCVGGIIAEPIISAIGNGWLFTIICGVGLLSCASVGIMQKWGPMWREKAIRGEYPFLQL